MDNEIFIPVDKQEGNGNGNSVINNHERGGKNKVNDYVSGDSESSSSSHQFKK